MRIVHVEAGRHRYGGAAQAASLVAGLERAGARNVLVCAAGGALAAAGHDALGGARVMPLPMGGDLDVRLVGRLRRAFAALEPDVVHVHSRRGADLYAGLACALDARPAVVTRRVDSREPAAWVRLKYRPYAAVVAISTAVERDLRERVGIDAARLHRVPSGIDPGRFCADAAAARERLAAAFALEADAFVVGVVAQLIGRKGHATLLAALPGLVRRHPRLRVLCFGRGPLARALAARIERAGLAQHVRLAGFADDLPDLVAGFDALVHPAEREGLGVAVLEAMSAGVPVVAAAAGGLVDVVEDGMSGLLFPPGDAAALGAALGRLVEDPALRARLGSRGRERVARRFTVSAMVERYLDIYERVLARPHAARLPHGRPV
ncbi:MAG TPA: glycosyltransferase family 4 protein [Gammaproteobacteria bacterium]